MLSDLDQVPIILELPPEVLLNIFRFINVRHLFGVVIRTCKSFHQILTSDGIWKTLFALKWEENDIVKDLQFINSWESLYISYEDIENFWTSNSENQLKKKALYGHYGVVDSVFIHPTKDVFVSGKFCKSCIINVIH